MIHFQNMIKTALVIASLFMFLVAAHMAKASGVATVQVPVLKDLVRMGTVITKDMLDYKEFPEASLNNAYTNVKDIVGKEAAANLRYGFPLRDGQLVMPLEVHRGDAVVLQFSKGGIHLTAEGKVLSDGHKGDMVEVINSASNKRVQGTVVGNNTVRVN